MNEDYSFNRNQKKGDERRLAPDFFGSLGKGMLAKENIETSGLTSGLTPLGFGVDVRNRIMNIGRVSDGFSTTECTENTEILKNSSGLSPLRPFGESHNQNMKSDYLGEGLATEGTETRRRLSGLSAPLGLRGEFHKRGVI